MTRIRRHALLLVVGVTLAAASASAEITGLFDGQVPCITQPGGVRYCGGGDNTVPTWDGVTPIDVNVALPPEPASGPDGNFPVIGIYHGWGGTKFFLATLGAYAARGYVAFSMTSRGWGNSCGASDPKTQTAQCDAGYNHVMDTRYDVRDAQYLLGRLADEGVIDPQRIGATGSSLGGSLSLALAALRDRVMMPDGTLVPWTSPAQGLPMRMAAALPELPWSDLAYGWIPNGDTLDYVVDAPYLARGRIGVMKRSLVDLLLVLGTTEMTNYVTPGADPDADMPGWYNLLLAGEPYDGVPAVMDVVDRLTAHHSAYYVDHSVTPAPLLISSGGTDDLFPVDEAVRFYERTRTEHPDADIGIVFLDYGHPRGQNKAADLAYLHTRQDAWLDHYVLGVGDPPPNGITALTQTCPASAPSEGPFSAPSWATLAPGEIRIASAPSQAIVPGAGDPARNNAYDPVLGSGACATAPGSDQPGVARYGVAPAPPSGFTLMGSPTVVADIESPGATSQIAARLLDVAPGGDAILVARALYRPDVTSGSPTRQVFQLHPNAYRFVEGHVAKLELLPADSPYGLTSNDQAEITVSNVDLRLPVLEPPDGSLVQSPAPKVVPPGYQLAFCASDGDCDDHDACNGAETCVDSACAAGTPPDCDDGDPCTTDTCSADTGCVHTNECGTLTITRARLRARGNDVRIQATGLVLTPPAVSGTPPIAIEVRDGAGHDVTIAFARCKAGRKRITCRDGSSHLHLGRRRGGSALVFDAALDQRGVSAPLAGPVRIALSHDGTMHVGSIVRCSGSPKRLRCGGP